MRRCCCNETYRTTYYMELLYPKLSVTSGKDSRHRHRHRHIEGGVANKLLVLYVFFFILIITDGKTVEYNNSTKPKFRFIKTVTHLIYPENQDFLNSPVIEFSV